MTALLLIVFHVVACGLLAAIATERVPRRWYGGLLRGMHNSIGITTPTDRQVKAVMIAWVASMIVIVDAAVLLLAVLSPA